MMIAAFLVYAGIATDTMDALQLFGDQVRGLFMFYDISCVRPYPCILVRMQRTTNGKGVTIPSQMRYVHYFEQCLRHGFEKFPVETYRIRHFRLITVPNFDVVRTMNLRYDSIRNEEFSSNLFGALPLFREAVVIRILM